MRARLKDHHYPHYVDINKDRASRLLKLVSELTITEGVISEHKLNLVVVYSTMVQRDINNQVKKGVYSNGLYKKEEEKEVKDTGNELAPFPAEGKS